MLEIYPLKTPKSQKNNTVHGGNMKKGIHPKYEKAVISCACGNSFESRSTVGDMKIDICSSCHPYYTGIQKFVDTDGRVDKFKKRAEKAKPAKKKD